MNAMKVIFEKYISCYPLKKYLLHFIIIICKKSRPLLTREAERLVKGHDHFPLSPPYMLCDAISSPLL